MRGVKVHYGSIERDGGAHGINHFLFPKRLYAFCAQRKTYADVDFSATFTHAVWMYTGFFFSLSHFATAFSVFLL